MNLLLGILALVMMLCSQSVFALDSYRYLHVTIDTPWMIFLFLLPIVLSPFIIMAILYWRFAGRKPDDENDDDGENDERKK